MSNERRKKGGARKEKKLQHMRESVEKRKAEAPPKDFGTDQKDIQTFKPGARNDRNQDPSRHSSGPGPMGRR